MPSQQQTICFSHALLVALFKVQVLALFKVQVLALRTVQVLALLVSVQAYSQEPAPEADAVQANNSGNRLLYIDIPIAIKDGLDPVFPEPAQLPDPEADPGFQRRVEDIRQYSVIVGDIELSGGAWDRALAEELSALGSLQQLQGNHVGAIETLNRAVHINRINEGLHTLEQVPVVESMIDSYAAVSDWANVDLYNNYLYFVQKRAYGTNDPRIIPVLDRLANWNIQAFTVGYGESLGMRLSTAQILFNAAARMVNVHFGKTDARLVELKTNVAKSAYLVSRFPEYMIELDRPENRTMEDILRESLNEQSRMQPRGFQSGEQALLDIIDYYSEDSDDVYVIAEAIANLGDWYTIFERRNAASDRYNQAYLLLAEMDDGEELIQQLFGQVIPIPTFGIPTNLEKASTNDAEPQGLRSGYADLAFDVTANGVVRRLQMLSEADEENSLPLTWLRREVRTSYFRPLVVDGRPVRSANNQFRYRYWY